MVKRLRSRITPVLRRETERPSRRRRSERGVALLLVIWVFIVLFVVVLDFASSMRDDGLATSNLADETRAYYVALAGFNRFIYDMLRELEENPDALELDEDFDLEDIDEEDFEDNFEAGDVELDGFSVASFTDGEWHPGQFGGGSYEVRMLDEGGKISLNRASEGLLLRVVRRLLVGGNATEGVLDCR